MNASVAMDRLSLGVAVSAVVTVAAASWFLKKQRLVVQQGDEPEAALPPPDALFCTLQRTGHRIRYTDTHHAINHTDTTSTETTSQVSTTTTTPNPTTTLVFVHGFGGCLETWQPLLPHLMNKQPPAYRLVCLDLLGNGFSDKPIGDPSVDYSFRGLRRDIVTDFVHTMGLTSSSDDDDSSKLVLVGHSAASIVLAAASAQLGREHCHGLCLVAPGFFLSKPSLLVRLPALGRALGRYLLAPRMVNMMRSSHLDPDGNIPPTVATAFAQQWKTRHAVEALQAMVTASEPPYYQALYDIPAAMPLHIVWSTQDRVNPPAVAKVQAYLDDNNGNSSSTASPKFTYAILSGSGHYLQHEVPFQLAQQIVDFVKGL